MTEHWSHIMDGTDGVCLKEVSAKNMILKNIAVLVLEDWLDPVNKNKHYIYNQAVYVAGIYDQVASNFGPHEITKSSRDRLFSKFKPLSLS